MDSEFLWLIQVPTMGMIGGLLIFFGRISKTDWIAATLGVLIVGALTALFGYSQITKAEQDGAIATMGTPSQLELGATYDIIPVDQVYVKLKGPDGIPRVYEIDGKLLPSVDRWLLPKLVRRFKYEEHKKLLIVPEDSPRETQNVKPETEHEPETK